jgi:phosphoglycerate dehydrogenase-like enzyme
VKVLITDMRHGSIEEEKRVLEPAGVNIETAFCRTEEELILHGQEVFAFLVSFAPVTRRVMESLPELKLIVRYGVGVDNVDLAAAREMGKKVARVPDYCVDEVVAHTLSLILAGVRMLFPLSQAAKNGNWIENPSSEKLRRLASLTAGIVGLGRISFFGADVFWQEPPGYSDLRTTDFLRRRDVLITPHMAWYSEESEKELRRKAAEEVLRFMRGEQLLHPV